MRILLILLVCPFMTGCLAYGYPSSTQTPTVLVEEPGVKAFRVTKDHTFFGAIIAGAFQIDDSLEEIEIWERQIPAQRDAYYAYYYLAFPFAAHHQRCVSVRLYRRGFETIDIEPRCCLISFWQKQPITVVWKTAATLETQEKIIDSLDPGVFGRQTGSSPEFLAGEYTNLAYGPLADEKSRVRLLEKAERIRRKNSP